MGGQVGGVEVQHHVPAPRGDAGHGAVEQVEVRRAAEVGDEVEPGAADAGVVQLVQLGVAGAVVDHRHAGVAARVAAQGVEQGAVVGAVAAGLDEHGPRQPEPGVEPGEVVDAGVGRRVAAAGREREAVRGAEHVAVGVARARRGREGPGRVRVGVGRRRSCAPSALPREHGAVHELAGGADDARPLHDRGAVLHRSGRRRRRSVPVGCSTVTAPPPPSRSATSAAGPSGSRAAVATLTAPSTPMASWHRWGMNVRVAIAATGGGGATIVSLGTVVAATSPRFMRGPAARRSRLERPPQGARSPPARRSVS